MSQTRHHQHLIRPTVMAIRPDRSRRGITEDGRPALALRCLAPRSWARFCTPGLRWVERVARLRSGSFSDRAAPRRLAAQRRSFQAPTRPWQGAPVSKA
jgi:hypothetical protein